MVRGLAHFAGKLRTKPTHKVDGIVERSVLRNLQQRWSTNDELNSFFLGECPREAGKDDSRQRERVDGSPRR